jgi:uncharacterized membrane protein
VGYEVIAAAMFACTLIWLSTKESVTESWRSWFLYLGFVDFIASIGLSFVEAVEFRVGLIFVHGLFFMALVGINLVSMVGELWAKTR